MGKVQKVYTKEFKQEAVRLVQTSGKPITQIARELGVSDSAIHSWRKELAEHGEEAFPGKGHQSTLEEEVARLKRELERVQQERDILKKVVSIFSRDQRCSYQFIEEHKHELAIVVMCGVLTVEGSVAFMPGANVQSADVSEKMLI